MKKRLEQYAWKLGIIQKNEYSKLQGLLKDLVYSGSGLEATRPIEK